MILAGSHIVTSGPVGSLRKSIYQQKQLKQQEQQQQQQQQIINSSLVDHHTLSSTKSLPVTETSSLALVHNLLSASFGSLAFLRGLFDDENFNDDVFNPPQDSDKQSSDNPVKPKKPFNIKRIKRGISPEADTLLDWIVCLIISFWFQIHKSSNKFINFCIFYF